MLLIHIIHSSPGFFYLFDGKKCSSVNFEFATLRFILFARLMRKRDDDCKSSSGLGVFMVHALHYSIVRCSAVQISSLLSVSLVFLFLNLLMRNERLERNLAVHNWIRLHWGGSWRCGALLFPCWGRYTRTGVWRQAADLGAILKWKYYYLFPWFNCCHSFLIFPHHWYTLRSPFSCPPWR